MDQIRDRISWWLTVISVWAVLLICAAAVASLVAAVVWIGLIGLASLMGMTTPRG